MSKIAAFGAVVLLIAFAAVPARADCPDGYCDDGTILPGSLAERHERHKAEARARYDRCMDACNDTDKTCQNKCLTKARQEGLE